MRHAPFRAYFATGLLSIMADNVEHVISYWVIFQAFHSPTLAGFAVISHWTPFLVLGVWFGGLADRYDCRKIIIASQAAFIAVSLAWAVLFLTGALRTWHAVVLLIVHGLAGALWSPAGQLIIHVTSSVTSSCKAACGSRLRVAVSASSSGPPSAARCCSYSAPRTASWQTRCCISP